MDLDYLPHILIVPISSRTGKDIHLALFWDYPIEGEEAIESFKWSLTFPTQFTTKKRNLVIIRATEPTQGEREIIWLVTLATLFTCTFRGGWQDSSSTRPAFNFSIRSSVACIVPSIVSRITPNQVITWRGSQRDFSSLGTNPDLSKSEWTTKLLTLAETKSVPPPKPSSRKIAIGMSWFLHDYMCREALNFEA